MDKVADFGLFNVTPEQILAFEPSEDSQEHVEDLMIKHHNASITEAEKAELDYYLEFEHLIRVMKARAAKVLAARAA